MEKNSHFSLHFSGHWSLVRCAFTADSGTTDHILFINTSVSFIENTKTKALTQNPRACELVKCLESQDMSPKVPFRCCGHCSQICMSTKQGTLLQLQSHTSNCPILGSWNTNDSLSEKCHGHFCHLIWVSINTQQSQDSGLGGLLAASDVIFASSCTLSSAT